MQPVGYIKEESYEHIVLSSQLVKSLRLLISPSVLPMLFCSLLPLFTNGISRFSCTYLLTNVEVKFPVPHLLQFLALSWQIAQMWFLRKVDYLTSIESRDRLSRYNQQTKEGDRIDNTISMLWFTMQQRLLLFPPIVPQRKNTRRRRQATRERNLQTPISTIRLST